MKLLRFRMKKLSDLRVPVLEPKKVDIPIRKPATTLRDTLGKIFMASFGLARKDEKKD